MRNPTKNIYPNIGRATYNDEPDLQKYPSRVVAYPSFNFQKNAFKATESKHVLLFPQYVFKYIIALLKCIY